LAKLQHVYLARPEVLAEKVPKTFKLFPVADYFYPAGGWCHQHNTEFCPEPGHEPNCIRWHVAWSDIFAGVGTYKLKTPIRIKDQMPGTGHMLTFAQFDGMLKIGWGTWITEHSRSFTIYADSDVAFRVEGDKISHGDNTWITNKYPMKVDISRYDTLDVELWQKLTVLTGGFSAHWANTLITVEYVPTTPPTPATVHIYVYDRQTSKPVGGALVQLLSGNKIVAQGYTGSDGLVTFQNVPGGEEGVSYTLLVAKSGYEDYKDEVEVVPGENSFRVPLVPIPTPPLPDWVKWLAIGSAVVVVGGVAIAATRKPAKPEVVVVKG